MAGISKSGPKPNNPFTFSLETPSLSSGTLDKYLKSVLGEDSVSAIPDLLKPSPSGENILVSRKTDDGTSSSDDKPQSGAATMIPITTSTSATAASTVLGATSTSQGMNISHHNPVPQDLSLQPGVSDIPHTGQALTTTNDNNELIPVPRGQNYVDITEYLNMPQADAAKKLGIPPSTLSKRWKEAVRKRKWPYRMICKIDKEIMTLLHNVPQGPNAPPLPEEIETALGISLRKRQEELRPVVIRI